LLRSIEKTVVKYLKLWLHRTRTSHKRRSVSCSVLLRNNNVRFYAPSNVKQGCRHIVLSPFESRSGRDRRASRGKDQFRDFGTNAVLYRNGTRANPARKLVCYRLPSITHRVRQVVSVTRRGRRTSRRRNGRFALRVRTAKSSRFR